MNFAYFSESLKTTNHNTDDGMYSGHNNKIVMLIYVDKINSSKSFLVPYFSNV